MADGDVFATFSIPEDVMRRALLGSTDERRPVFLCHSSADKEQVRGLYRRLDEDGYGPWFDEEHLVPGQDWAFAVRAAIQAAEVVVVCLSKLSTTRAGYANREIKMALDIADEQPEGTIFVVPLRLEECTVPERLGHLHWVDLFAAGGYERLGRALLQGRRGTSS